MGKKFWSFVVVLFVLTVMASYTQSASAQEGSVKGGNVAVSGAKANNVVPMNQFNSKVELRRAARRQIGFGFNGIPFDGSHLEALRMRRAYRGE